MDCLFCKRDFPADRQIAENETWYALWDANPVSDGHALVIPKEHHDSFFNLSQEDVLSGYVLSNEVKNEIEQKYIPDAYTVGVNDGIAAGRTIHHLHIHIIPRYVGDVENPRGGVRHVIPGKGDYE